MSEKLRQRLEAYRYTSRLEKARKIQRILARAYGGTGVPPPICCLDLGCSIGVITSELGRFCEKIFGLEIDPEALDLAGALDPSLKNKLIRGDALALPFPDGRFDLVICAQVYEHTRNPQNLFREIDRILKIGGCCFLSGPNRWWPWEYHYHWLFLHWLPRGLVDRFCRRRYGRPYDLVLNNYWQLKRFWKNYALQDYSLQLLVDAEYYLDRPKPYRLVRYLPLPWLKLFIFLFPNFNWVLIKK